MSNRIWIVAVIVAVPLVAYPLVGLAGGAPRFPTRSECVHAAVEGQPIAVVFGRTDDPLSAMALRDRALEVGFTGTESVPDGCGRWKVLVGGVPSIAVGREVVDEARTVGLAPTLEVDSGN